MTPELREEAAGEAGAASDEPGPDEPTTDEPATDEPAPEGEEGAEDGADVGIRGSEWVRRRPGDHRTLQLLASHRQEVVQRAAEEGSWSNPVATVLTADGWYLLLHGDYADVAAAEAAAGELAEATELEPWQRPFSAIQGRLPGNAAVPEGDGEPASEAEGAAWLAEHTGEVTLQLFATRERERAETFRAEQERETRLLAVERDGTSWYLVVTGAWPDREAARAAVDQLPAELRELGPWPRPVDELREARAAGD